jgi:small subunit ribosomal protein S8
MSVTDPVADMLNRIRNACSAGTPVAEMPHSRLKGRIAEILQKEGYVRKVEVEGEPRKVLRIHLKYFGDRVPTIRGLRRASRPGLRRYVKAQSMPRVLGGLGVAIVSTSQGVMTGQEARQRGVGGELLCQVW